MALKYWLEVSNTTYHARLRTTKSAPWGFSLNFYFSLIASILHFNCEFLGLFSNLNCGMNYYKFSRLNFLFPF